jgi:hypothetical protein
VDKKKIKKTIIFITASVVPFALTFISGYYGVKYLNKKKRERDLLHNKKRGNNGTNNGGTGSNAKT